MHNTPPNRPSCFHVCRDSSALCAVLPPTPSSATACRCCKRRTRRRLWHALWACLQARQQRQRQCSSRWALRSWDHAARCRTLEVLEVTCVMQGSSSAQGEAVEPSACVTLLLPHGACMISCNRCMLLLSRSSQAETATLAAFLWLVVRWATTVTCTLACSRSASKPAAGT